MKNLPVPYLLFLTIILTAIYGCAKIGHPSGGPKDVTPPEVVKSNPPDRTTNFKETKITITFDEYIKLKDVYQELIISPPMEKKPLPHIRNKSLVIDLDNELKDSTTYTLNFGNSLVDNNEENPLIDFEYTFSTTNFIDSMTVMGQILNAFTLTPPKDPAFIMLYDNLNDSMPLKEKPV